MIVTKTTKKIAEKLGIEIEVFTANFEDYPELEQWAKGEESAEFVEIYNETDSCEWHVRYVVKGDSLFYAGHIYGEDYPHEIKGVKGFNDFLKDFARVYANN